MYVIMYHYVREIKRSIYPNIKGLELEYFKQQIEFLKQNDFKFVSLKQLIEEKCDSENSVLLTFDDGYIDHYANVFPILQQNGITGVFSMPGKIIREKKVLDVNKIHYVLANTNEIELRNKLFRMLDYYRGTEFRYPSNQELYNKLAIESRFDCKDVIFIKRILQVGLPERLRNIITDELFKEYVSVDESDFVDGLYMNMEQIKEMSYHGMEFGIHGYDHYWMDNLAETKLIEDLESALDVFEGVIDPQNWCCCYPYGAYNDRVIQTAKQLGATSGLTTNVAICQIQKHGVYEIPRLDTNDFPPQSEYYLHTN